MEEDCKNRFCSKVLDNFNTKFMGKNSKLEQNKESSKIIDKDNNDLVR